MFFLDWGEMGAKRERFSFYIVLNLKHTSVKLPVL